MNRAAKCKNIRLWKSNHIYWSMHRKKLYSSKKCSPLWKGIKNSQFKKSELKTHLQQNQRSNENGKRHPSKAHRINLDYWVSMIYLHLACSLFDLVTKCSFRTLSWHKQNVKRRECESVRSIFNVTNLYVWIENKFWFHSFASSHFSIVLLACCWKFCVGVRSPVLTYFSAEQIVNIRIVFVWDDIVWHINACSIRAAWFKIIVYQLGQNNKSERNGMKLAGIAVNRHCQQKLWLINLDRLTRTLPSLALNW